MIAEIPLCPGKVEGYMNVKRLQRFRSNAAAQEGCQAPNGICSQNDATGWDDFLTLYESNINGTTTVKDHPINLLCRANRQVGAPRTAAKYASAVPWRTRAIELTGRRPASTAPGALGSATLS